MSLSIVLGALLVPLSGYAASLLIEPTVSPGPETAEAVTTVEPPPAAGAASAADLVAACGDVGLAMVAAESEGSISTFEQAALDALRQVCAEQGLALPEKPVATSLTTAATSIEPPSPPPSQPTPAPPSEPGGAVEWEEDRDDDDWELEVRYDLDGHGEDHD